jgi:hypothetical protein
MSQMDQIALQNKQPVVMVAKVATPAPVRDATVPIVHRL